MNCTWFSKNSPFPYKKTFLFFGMVLISSIVMACVHCQAKKDFEERHALIKNMTSADLSKSKEKISESRSVTCKDSTHILLIERYSSLAERQNKDIEDIKQTLEDEFNKIENEYESQEIWTGLLTIVFLVFTFYSLLKTEEQERQAQDTLRQIKRSERRSRSIIGNIETDKEKAIQEIKTEFNTWKDSKNDDVENIAKALFNEKKKDFETDFDSWLKKFQEKEESELNTINQTLEKNAYDKLKNIFEKDIEQKIQNFGEELKRKLDIIDKEAKQQMEAFINKLNSQFETPETEASEIETANEAEPDEAKEASADMIDEKYELEESTSDKE